MKVFATFVTIVLGVVAMWAIAITGMWLFEHGPDWLTHRQYHRQGEAVLLLTLATEAAAIGLTCCIVAAISEAKS